MPSRFSACCLRRRQQEQAECLLGAQTWKSIFRLHSWTDISVVRTTSSIIAVCALLTSCGRGQGPDDTIRNAYAWYVRELKSGVNPLEQKRTELKEFVTDGFLTSIENMRTELESNPFMDAQSFDAKLSIEKITKDSHAATVRIGLSGRICGQQVLNVYLVKVEGRWKVDDVKAVEDR